MSKIAVSTVQDDTFEIQSQVTEDHLRRVADQNLTHHGVCPHLAVMILQTARQRVRDVEHSVERG